MADFSAWSERALIAITKVGGAEIYAESLTESIDFDMGDKEFESFATLNGARVTKFTPQGEATVTLTAYAKEAGTSTGTTMTGFHDLMHAVDSLQPITVTNTHNRDQYRICILWTDKLSETNATAAISSTTNKGCRIIMADGYFTRVKPSFTDGILKFEITYKTPPFDGSKSSNVIMESVASDTTAYTMTALSSYTTTTKFQ